MVVRLWKTCGAAFGLWVAVGALAFMLAIAETPARAAQVQTAPTAFPATNDSGSITTGNTFQVFLAQKSNRQGCFIQNTNASDVLYVFVNDGVKTKTKANSYQVAAGGGSWSCTQGGILLPNEIDITGPTTGDTFAAGDQ